MGLLSRNGSAAGWFTLQDEPVDHAIGKLGPSASRPVRGRGLVKLVEPAAQPPSRSAGDVRASADEVHARAGEVHAGGRRVSEARLTRVSPLEQLNAHAARLLSAIAASRFGALALSLVLIALAVATIGLIATRGASDHAQIQAYKAQIARLMTDRDRAPHLAAQEGHVSATAQAGPARRRSLAPAGPARRRSLAQAVERSRGAGKRGAGHSNSRGGGR